MELKKVKYTSYRATPEYEAKRPVHLMLDGGNTTLCHVKLRGGYSFKPMDDELPVTCGDCRQKQRELAKLTAKDTSVIVRKKSQQTDAAA